MHKTVRAFFQQILFICEWNLQMVEHKDNKGYVKLVVCKANDLSCKS